MKRVYKELFKNAEQEGGNPKNGVAIHNVLISSETNSNNMNPVEDWLQTYDSKSRNQKKHNLMMFLNWLEKTPEDTLTLRKQDQNRAFENSVLNGFTI